MFPGISENSTVQLIIYEAENGDLEDLVSGLARGTRGAGEGTHQFHLSHLEKRFITVGCFLKHKRVRFFLTSTVFQNPRAQVKF